MIEEPKKTRTLVWVMCCLTLIADSICVTIEVLNARAGYILPRTLPTEGNPKWRWAVVGEKWWKIRHHHPRSVANPEVILGEKWPLAQEDKELLERLLEKHANEFSGEEQATMQSVLAAHQRPGERELRELITLVPMSAEQQAEMKRDISARKRNNSLHAAVQTTGLLQYLLAPVTWIVAFAVLFDAGTKRHRRLATACLAVVSVSIVLMFYRAYFTSLGW